MPSKQEINTDTQPMETATPAPPGEGKPRKRGRMAKGQTIKVHKQIIALTRNDATLTQQNVADLVGVERATVSRVLAKYGINQEELEEFKTNQADILLGLQHRISKSIDDETIQKAGLKDRTVALGVLYDKYRLQTNQSTQNVASLHSIADRAIRRAAGTTLEPDNPTT
jgi:predicted transcriptional regulator